MMKTNFKNTQTKILTDTYISRIKLILMFVGGLSIIIIFMILLLIIYLFLTGYTPDKNIVAENITKAVL